MHILNYRRILGEHFRCFLLSELRDAHGKHMVYEGYERDIAVASYQPGYLIQIELDELRHAICSSTRSTGTHFSVDRT